MIIGVTAMIRRENLQQCLRASLGALTLLAILVAGPAPCSFAADEVSFDSAEQAVEALYKAVGTLDHVAIARLVGPLASSADTVQDKADRQRFIQKYSEMHRLVRAPDGSTVLYIGAENWPFPVPLVSHDGKWRFDPVAGAREIMFRRIGEDETAAVETCRSMAKAGDQNAPAQSARGYQFRVLPTSNGAVVVAFPSEYGSTGVMTFVATPDGTVREKDLGPRTVERAQTMTRYKPDRTWHVSELSPNPPNEATRVR
jgi:hypothetical protein